MNSLKISNMSCGYGSKTVVRNVTMEFGTGEILCLLGPNGTGKTTYFKTILGFLKLQAGEVILDGKPIGEYKRNELAKKIGYVPQNHSTPFPFTVLDIVVMGRSAHLGMFASPSKNDYRIACESLESLGISHLKDRLFTHISGGEKQMALIARVLTQQTKLLIMDEPTSNLDFGNQIKVLSHIGNLAKNGISVIMTSHFPNHAFLCSSKVALMHKGEMMAYGEANDIITEERLRTIYGIDVRIIDYEYEGKVLKNCIPLI
jgi:iron complex transport system ATP-binding protein